MFFDNESSDFINDVIESILEKIAVDLFLEKMAVDLFLTEISKAEMSARGIVVMTTEIFF